MCEARDVNALSIDGQGGVLTTATWKSLISSGARPEHSEGMLCGIKDKSDELLAFMESLDSRRCD